MNSLKKILAASVVIAAFASACSSASYTAPPVATDTPVPATAAVAGASATAAMAATSTPAAAAGATLMAQTIGGQTILVAGSNGMTVYTFSSDTADSGKSECSGGCLTKWPALSVPAGSAPTAGTGVTGKLGTITRDDGTLQVTYNGLPLYFYAGDKTPGDTNGSYPNWNLVKP